MRRDDLQRKIIQQWGANSEEAKLFKQIYRNALQWEKYEYEKYGLGMHDKEKKQVQSKPKVTEQNVSHVELPKDYDIFRATWSYFLARAAFIFMMWIVFMIVMGLLFWGIYAAVDAPSWDDVSKRHSIEQRRVIR
jgi:hypothetical protein